MPLFTLDELYSATTIVRTLVPPTPTYAWPLLRKRTGVEIIVKHENHTPTGSFKVRGGLVYIDAMLRAGQLSNGLVTATRGNHGQSVALSATRNGIPSVIVVPEGNSPEKNAAMQAFGAEIVIAGKDFDESRLAAARIQQERNYHLVPTFHRELVKGVATYAYELFEAAVCSGPPRQDNFSTTLRWPPAVSEPGYSGSGRPRRHELQPACDTLMPGVDVPYYKRQNNGSVPVERPSTSDSPGGKYPRT